MESVAETIEAKYEATAEAALPKIVLAPIRDRILVMRDESIKERGGMALPDTAQEEMLSGTVLAVGKRVEEIASGDRVRFGRYTGQPLPDDHPRLIAMREDEIVCKEAVLLPETEAQAG